MRKRSTQRRVRTLKSYFDGGGLDELAATLRTHDSGKRRDSTCERADPREEVGGRSRGRPAESRPV
jgi:hypothetical protein